MPEPSWSAQLITVGGFMKPSAPSCLRRASSIFRFSRPQRTCSPVIGWPLPNLPCAVRTASVVKMPRGRRGCSRSSRCASCRRARLGPSRTRTSGSPYHREVRAGRVEPRGDVAFRRLARRDHVLLGPRPPYAYHLVPRKAHLGRRLERGRVHHPPAPQDHPVGPDLADLQPLRLLLVARMRYRDVRHLEAVLLRLHVQDRNGLLAVGRVVVEVHNFLALQLVHPAFAHADELDLGGVLRPVVRDQREDVRKTRPSEASVRP